MAAEADSLKPKPKLQMHHRCAASQSVKSARQLMTLGGSRSAWGAEVTNPFH